MRIVFMGTPEFAVPSLEALLRSDDSVVGVMTQPDRPKGRGQVLAASPVKLVCQRESLPILQPVKMKEPAFLEALRAWQPDLIAVAAFGRILPKVILDMPPRGCVNVHASLLPKYRGAGPIQWALINGERETGITTMLMDEGMDTGAILLQEQVEIQPEDTAGSLSARLAVVGGRLLVETIRRLKDGTVIPRPQDHAQATLAPLLKKEDGLIDWKHAAAEIANRVRGLSPWPGAYTYAGDDRWIIWRAAPTDRPPGTAIPGTIIEACKGRILVATGKGLLAITELQPVNSRRMGVAQYLAGHILSTGLVLGAGPSPSNGG
ncbi:MAG: methionyl-tRNA formyltransferase [Nitrospiraceae bacterium]